MEGFEKTEQNGLNKLENSGIFDVDPIDENFRIHEEKIGNVESVNLKGYSDNKSLVGFIKHIWKSLSEIELTDLKVKVTTWSNKTLDKVLKDLNDRIGTLNTLKTTNKTNLVSAINENFDKNEEQTEFMQALGQAELLDRQDINTLKEELTGEDNELRINNERFASLLGVEINDIRRGVS